MRGLYIFLLRLLISLVAASIVSIFFFEGIRLLRTSLLAGVMIILAYLFEWAKNREGE